MRPASLAFTALTTTLTLAAGAFSGATPKYGPHERTAHASPIGAAALRYGRSLGSPTEGHLLGGAHLLETEYLRIEPNDAGGDVRWGLEPLVAMIERAARTLRQRFPGTITSVGHLSREGGGDVDRHRSHESGRDADVGFFVRNALGKQLLAPHFVSFKADGTAPTWPGAYFDDAKNWALVSAMVDDSEAHVTHLFVASPLRARLLAYAERVAAPESVRMRAAELMQQPHGVLPHDDHFHVRIGCPAQMTGCVENPAPRIARTSPLPRAARPHHEAPARARGLVTPAPTRGAPVPPPSTGGPLPFDAPADSGEPKGPNVDAPAPEPSAPPPALLSAPVDDVDG